MIKKRVAKATTGQAPPCAVCGSHRDAGIHLRNSIYGHAYSGSILELAPSQPYDETHLLEEIDEIGAKLALGEWMDFLEKLRGEINSRLDAAKDDLKRARKRYKEIK